ncbi:hypothetical protein K9F62_04305 [Desulfovibrio sp. JY]|nr:hypothetical protein K9F62_04305 [Desulfovibrio sp. JY]
MKKTSCGAKKDVVPPVPFAEALRQGAGTGGVTLDILKGADHLGEQFTTPENTGRVLDFLDTHMR